MNAGALARKERLANALVRRLRADPRVRAAYGECAEIGARLDLRDEDIRAAMRARISWLVRNDLGLPWPWLTALLQRDVMVWLLGHLANEPLHAELVAPDVPDLPRGRAPKGDDYLTRDVDWYVRVRVQRPPAPIKALAREYALATGRRTDARSVVQTAIHRIERLLGTLDAI